jgi:hypothetical protein
VGRKRKEIPKENGVQGRFIRYSVTEINSSPRRNLPIEVVGSEHGQSSCTHLEDSILFGRDKHGSCTMPSM